MISGGIEATLASTRPNSRSMKPAAVGRASSWPLVVRLRTKNDASSLFYGVTHLLIRGDAYQRQTRR